MRPMQSEWTALTVVRHIQQNEVALDFIVGCPYYLGIAAILGLDIFSSSLGLPDSDDFSNSGD